MKVFFEEYGKTIIVAILIIALILIASLFKIQGSDSIISIYENFNERSDLFEDKDPNVGTFTYNGRTYEYDLNAIPYVHYAYEPVYTGDDMYVVIEDLNNENYRGSSSWFIMDESMGRAFAEQNAKKFKKNNINMTFWVTDEVYNSETGCNETFSINLYDGAWTVEHYPGHMFMFNIIAVRLIS